jgi:hypothetical protein
MGSEFSFMLIRMQFKELSFDPNIGGNILKPALSNLNSLKARVSGNRLGSNKRSLLFLDCAREQYGHNTSIKNFKSEAIYPKIMASSSHSICTLTSQTVLGMLSLLWLLDTISFQFRGPVL